MYYTIVINENILDDKAQTHGECVVSINDYIKSERLQSSLVTKNIIDNWLSRNLKSNKWNFINIVKN